MFINLSLQLQVFVSDCLPLLNRCVITQGLSTSISFFFRHHYCSADFTWIFLTSYWCFTMIFTARRYA